ncbi:hypothetical protein [Ensifer soli]|uniref:hypothetical protein n=1 Tax=Ciceribacter sp. sgz301302 TaxID=3342379 RepID=UPI0035BA5ED8
MPISVSEFASSPDFFNAILGHARTMVAGYSENPRVSSIFASQQRWLMAHAGFALHFDTGHEGGLYAARFIAAVTGHNIASRNTAASFLQEMQAYKLLRLLSEPPDKRIRRLEPTEQAMTAMRKWVRCHLALLDSLDGGSRVATFENDPCLIARLQPFLASRILRNPRLRQPGPTFDLFTWANSGGVVMDFLFARITDFDPDMDRVMIEPFSPRDVAEHFLISKTHLKRLIGKAAEMGSNGWDGLPGKSRFWISRDFIREYWDYQAEKFALVEEAYRRAAQSARKIGGTEGRGLTSPLLHESLRSAAP